MTQVSTQEELRAALLVQESEIQIIADFDVAAQQNVTYPLDQFYERQMAQAEMAAAKQRTAAKLAPVGPCEPMCGALEGEARKRRRRGGRRNTRR